MDKDKWAYVWSKNPCFSFSYPRSGPHEIIATNGVIVVCLFPKNFSVTISLIQRRRKTAVRETVNYKIHSMPILSLSLVSYCFLFVLYFKISLFLSSGMSTASKMYCSLSKHSHMTVKPLADNLTSSFPPWEMSHAWWVSSALNNWLSIIRLCEREANAIKQNKQQQQTNQTNKKSTPLIAMLFQKMLSVTDSRSLSTTSFIYGFPHVIFCIHASILKMLQIFFFDTFLLLCQIIFTRGCSTSLSKASPSF